MCFHQTVKFLGKNSLVTQKINSEVAPEQLKCSTTPQGCERQPRGAAGGTVRLIVSIAGLLPIQVGKFAF